MNDSLEQFRDLAWRALESPTDPALREQLAAQLNAHPEWAGEWREIREGHQLAAEAAHASHARAEADRTEEIPAARLAALLGETAATSNPHRLARSRRGRWLAFVAGIALVASTAWLVERTVSPAVQNFDAAPWVARASPSLARALTAPLATVLASAELPTLRSDASVTLRSPILATIAGEVTLAWTEATPASVTILGAGRPVWTAANIHSPARTTALAADRLYEIVLTPADGGTPVRERFVTVAAAAATAASVSGADSDHSGLAKVLAALVAEPARLGDAVLAWHALPEKMRHSETGARLGLWLGVAARQPDLLAEARAAAQSGLSSNR